MYSISEHLRSPLPRDLRRPLPARFPHRPTTRPKPAHLRDERAMTAVAHLLPENAAEAEVAVLVVAAQFRAREALRAASQPGLEPDQTRRCTAQAASMMRQADGSIRTLLRMQAETAEGRDRHAPRRNGTGRLLVPLSLGRRSCRIPGLTGDPNRSRRTAAAFGTRQNSNTAS